MLNSLKRLFSKTEHSPVEPFCPPGERIYCIGDIHGRDDLLQQLHANIEADASGYSGKKTLIYLGDYIDRGENSMQVIELLLNDPVPGFETVYLRGNHEQTLLDFLGQAEVGASWFNFGGLQTLVSYGVRYRKLPTQQQDLEKLQQDLRQNIPRSHLQFFEQTRYAYLAGNYYFVHAGIDPRRSLQDQEPEAQLWIRNEFVGHYKPYEKIIVHGHTISDHVEFRSNRIGLDTGAYLSGKLSCLVLEDDTHRVIQTNA